MRELLSILAVLACMLLSGCSPVVDAEFHNGTGEPIVVTNLAQSTFHASIPAGGSAPVDVFVLRSGQPVGFSVTAAGHVWIYRHHTRFLASVSPQYWRRGPFESKRLHVSVDSRGRIYLLSPSGAPVSQPAGFPIHPHEQQTDLTNRSSQPLAVSMRSFDFLKQFFVFAMLAPASGGSAPSR